MSNLTTESRSSPAKPLTPQERREKMVHDAEEETRNLLREIQLEREAGLVRPRWYEFIRASFG